MRSLARARSFASFLMVVCLLVTPLTALAKKGEKNYKRGIEHEKAQQWEKAAQEFALAVAAAPSDVEYQLHYRRAIFNASQVFMQKGRALYEQGDFVGAYNAFRQAAGYDPVNELAVQEMQRMMRLQREKEGTTENTNGVSPAPRHRDSATISPTSFQTTGGVRATTAALQQGDNLPPLRSEQKRIINYNGELEPFIRKLAEDLDLNVIFDKDFSTQQKRNITINLRDVTTAQTLDYIFLAYGLFFQKLSRRTILVADQSKRPQYQQLVLRTFYLSNIDPNDARTLITSALPANAGRQPSVTLNKATNSITVRDTPENVRIIGELLESIDKDRAEVVMDVSIYEVSRTDLLQLGNQLGTADRLGSLGGTSGLLLTDGSRQVASQLFGAVAPTAFGLGIAIPASTLSALQSKSNTRLIFSTQVHAFDDEKSETRIGQKVPVQTANVTPFGFNGGQGAGGTGGGTGVNQGLFGGTGFPVIQYEDTGLSLDFTPKVYPNHDVQVKMVIETKDAGSGGGTTNLTPTFSQRRITGVARIPNNKTMMIASVAQDRVEDGRAGLPLLGLIPVLGRLFSTPRRNNNASDIVITMTPRVLRAPNITPEDQIAVPSGSVQTPTTQTLEAMVRDADREDQLAAARSLPTNTAVQLPPAETATFVPAPKSLMDGATATDSLANNPAASATASTTANMTVATSPAANALVPGVAAGGASIPAQTVSLERAGAASTQPVPALTTANASTMNTPLARAAAPPTLPAAPAVSSAELRLVPEEEQARAGETRRMAVTLKTDAPLGLATATLRFDPRVMTVRSVSKGAMFDERAAPVIMQSIDPTGVLVISIAPAAGAPAITGEGELLIIEVEAIATGLSSFSFDAGKLHLIATDGRSVLTQVTQSQFKVVL